MRGREEMERNIKKFEARVLAHAANGDISLSEWEYNVELEGMGPLTNRSGGGPSLERWQGCSRAVLSQVIGSPGRPPNKRVKLAPPVE
jgi:hypothetical protein